MMKINPLQTIPGLSMQWRSQLEIIANKLSYLNVEFLSPIQKHKKLVFPLKIKDDNSAALILSNNKWSLEAIDGGELGNEWQGFDLKEFLQQFDVVIDGIKREGFKVVYNFVDDSKDYEKCFDFSQEAVAFITNLSYGGVLRYYAIFSPGGVEIDNIYGVIE